MPQVNINTFLPKEAEKRRQSLQYIEDNLETHELERLEKIARSSKAKEYLNAKFFMLKSFLKL